MMARKSLLQWDRAMFNRLNEQVRGKKQWYRIGQVLPILSANALLSDKSYAYCIEKVKQLAGLPEDHFDHFYQGFIQRFAEVVQAIPEEWDAPLGSLLTGGLLRGLNTLHLFVTEFNDATPLERYALFTACVLRDIHNIVTNQKIFITDEQGATLQVWQPFCGSLTEEVQGQNYKLIPLSSAYQRIGKTLRTVLARQVIGESGFLWIASDLRLLTEWLEALNEEEGDGSGRLAHVIKRYRRQGNGLLDSLPAIMFDILDSPATEYADQFYQWLIDGLNDGTIKVNRADAHVHITDAGVFVEFPAIFKTFAELYNVPVNHYVVFTQIGNLMGLARKGGGDYQHVQLYSAYPDAAGGGSGYRGGLSSPLVTKSNAMRDGILIGDINTLYLQKDAPEKSPYMKVPSSIKRSVDALAAFNAVTKLNTGMTNR